MDQTPRQTAADFMRSMGDDMQSGKLKVHMAHSVLLSYIQYYEIFSRFCCTMSNF